MTFEYYSQLKSILDDKKISIEPKILEQYKSDNSFGFVDPKVPKCIIWPENIKDIQQIVKFANEKTISLVPLSSETPRFHGTSVPRNDNTIIIDFTKMKKILNIDVKNRGVMLEAGVNFEEYINAAKEAGLRPHLPLYPYAKKSVVGAALDREPVIIPKYHWDIADPLLCTEVVFGTGNMFRTGAAAGPGSLTQQKESGGAQKNPMGPTQFSPFRIIQGAQGTIALVNWATLKVQQAINLRKNYFITSEKLDTNFDFIYEILKYRLGDEIFILNNLNLASLLQKDEASINKMRDNLPNWIGIISITGSGSLAEDKIAWQQGDISEYATKFGVELKENLPNISDEQIRIILEEASPVPWRLKYKGGCNDIFFISTLDKTPKYKEIMWKNAEKFNSKNIGVYIQPLVQGCNVHCEFDLFYNPEDQSERSITKDTFIKCSQALINNGAFFNRPYGIWADMIYPKVQPNIIKSMQKVKNIFDPNNVLSPGALCFKEGLN
ncbi:MAG: FAD-binding oxidoreductase [Candidatus Lokiarchaeota archaeon]|nr:FAD-binding oxidoreductase [Candidatus Lokiarchaeota archaeon]